MLKNYTLKKTTLFNTRTKQMIAFKTLHVQLEQIFVRYKLCYTILTCLG